jgi:hypothetical protein
MTNETTNPNDEKVRLAGEVLPFLRHCCFVIHSAFEFRHSEFDSGGMVTHTAA